jgi:hypothetical protein
LFIDDAQMMGKGMLARTRRFPGVVVATQVDMGMSFRKAGFDVRTRWVPDTIGQRHLQAIVERRLEWARRGPGPIPRVGKKARSGLLGRHGHNLRAMLADLYDRYQQLEALE